MRNTPSTISIKIAKIGIENTQPNFRVGIFFQRERNGSILGCNMKIG